MKKPFDVKCTDDVKAFEQAMTGLFNAVDLPISIKRMAVIDWSNDIIDRIDETIETQRREYEAQQSTGESEVDSDG